MSRASSDALTTSTRAAPLRGRVVAPVRRRPDPACSGKVTRHRLKPGGNRQSNYAPWRIVLTRLSSHTPTRAYVERRTAEGLSKKEIIRCLNALRRPRRVPPPAPGHRLTHTLRGDLTLYSAAASVLA